MSDSDLRNPDPDFQPVLCRVDFKPDGHGHNPAADHQGRVSIFFNVDGFEYHYADFVKIKVENHRFSAGKKTTSAGVSSKHG